MGMTISNGTTLAVSSVLPTAATATAFAALPFTQIRGVRTVGDIGQTWQTVTNNKIGGIRPTQRRTSLAPASLDIEMFRITDEGQNLLKAAMSAIASYSYRITEPDGTKTYFTALAIGRTASQLSSGSIATIKVTLDIDSAVLTT